jgi:hypothetical protein
MILIGFWDSMDKGLLSLLMMLSAVAIMVVLLRRHQFRHATRKDVVREQNASLRDQHRLRQSMDDLLVQLEEVSRRVSAQVDTKFAQLDAVVRDADERIVRLERLLGKREPEAPAARSASLGPPAPQPMSLASSPQQPMSPASTASQPMSPTPAAPAREPRRRSGPPADVVRTPPVDGAERTAAELNAVPSATRLGSADPAVLRRDSADPRFQPLYDLIDSGHSPIQAAEALSLPLGEVELILNLRRYR